VKQVPEERQPREQFDRMGAAGVSDEILLAIILNQGTHGHNVQDMAAGLMDHFGSLNNLAEASMEELTRIKGIGPIKARIIMSAMEVSRRMQREQLPSRPCIDDPEQAAQLLRQDARESNEEVFWAILLDIKNGLIKAPIEVTRGILNASLVHPREVFKEAIKSSAAALVVAHNHPSGDAEPSAEDIKITRELVQAGKIMGIPVLDHVIVGKEHADKLEPWYYSIRESGLVIFEDTP